LRKEIAMKRIICAFVLVLFATLPAWAASGGGGFILLSTTIGPIDSGIVGALEDAFEKETGIRVRHVGAGTTAALELAKKGEIDLVMAHAKSAEEAFVKGGFGTARYPLMYNDFVIVGPAADPAGIKGMASAAQALKTIAAKEAPFVTRGDKSGTHLAELAIWQKAGVKPAGGWYRVFEKGAEGNVPTLLYTDAQKAYTFMDRATYLTLKNKIKLAVLVEKDEALLNRITLIPVNPKKLPKANYADTMTFVNWLTDPGKGQLVIRDFGRDKYGSPLFFPDSEAWVKAGRK
jgi:tungstate transport system substrate-binding protein